MTVAVANTLITNAIDYHRSRTNEIAYALSTYVVTVSNPVNGNAVVNGYISSNNLVATTLRGGNISTSGVLTVTSNLAVNGVSFTVGNSSVNTVINSTSITINSYQVLPVLYSVNTQTTGTSAQLIDYFSKTTYRGADYVCTITDNSANAYQINKLILVHDVGSTYLSSYGIIWSNTNLGTFSANANSTHVTLFFTPTISNSQVKAIKTVVVV